MIKSANCGWVIPPENIEELIRIMNKVTFLPKEELKHKEVTDLSLPSNIFPGRLI